MRYQVLVPLYPDPYADSVPWKHLSQRSDICCDDTVVVRKYDAMWMLSPVRGYGYLYFSSMHSLQRLVKVVSSLGHSRRAATPIPVATARRRSGVGGG